MPKEKIAAVRTRKTDRRTLYTIGVIKDAFLALIADNSYDKINVTSICKEAEISRATFYLHFDNVDAVLDSVIDDALLFSEQGQGTVMDLVDISPDAGEPLLPACQRIADSDRYHALFMDPLVSDHIIHRIFRHEHDTIVPQLMSHGNINEDEAEMIFRFILNGSFAVNRSLGWYKDERWYRFQTLLGSFVAGGMDSVINGVRGDGSR